MSATSISISPRISLKAMDPANQEYKDFVFDEKLVCEYKFDPETGVFECSDEREDLKELGVVNPMNYSTTTLTSWKAFRMSYMSVWTCRELWFMMLHLMLLAIFVACATVALVKNPEVLRVSEMTQITQFLNVITGLLLGFFFASSLKRWYTCVDGFSELLDAIRHLQMQFAALGVGEKERFLALRYSIASAWLLYGGLLVETRPLKPVEEREHMWEVLAKKKAPLCKSTESDKLLMPSEIDFLATTRDPPGIMFMWIAALIGRMAQEGVIPPMASPTYGRIMKLCHDAQVGIRRVRSSVSIQSPLNYAHMLATVVHLNNIVNALALGLALGVSAGTFLMSWFPKYYPKVPPDVNMKQEVTQDFQDLLITWIYCFLSQVLYQSCLIIGMHLAQPFNAEDARVPLHRLLHQLEVDMINTSEAQAEVPFEAPRFKK